MKVFLSRPTSLSHMNHRVIEEFEFFLKSRDIETVTIGSNKFTNDSPLVAVKEEMLKCDGAIIIGFSQTYIKEGTLKYKTEFEKNVSNSFLSTPWNQIEAAVAFTFGMPFLIVADNNISGGIFDPGVTNNFIHKYDLDTSTWLNEKNSWIPSIIGIKQL